MSRRLPSASCERTTPARRERDLSAHASVLRALGDEGRLQIVARLATTNGAMCVCDLMTGIELSQPTVSHHLRVLKDAGVVRSERRGSWVYYTLELAVIGVLADLITALAPAAGHVTEAC